MKVNKTNAEIDNLKNVYGIDAEAEILKELLDSMNESILNDLGVQSPRQIEAERKRLLKIKEDRDKKIDDLLDEK